MDYHNRTEYKLDLELSEFQYTKKLGGFKPKFQGLPDDYFPLTTKQAFLYAFLVVATIGFALGLMIGFLKWVEAQSTDQFAVVWSIILLCFWVALIILFYVGGRKRIREEKRMIAEAHKQQQQLIKGNSFH